MNEEYKDKEPQKIPVAAWIMISFLVTFFCIIAPLVVAVLIPG